ncbi:hypothetical protein [Neobacillus sp. GCM10023253]|uniref:hypothetical protein n=1 Tax=Neobacillus sp. GCM10023253 TaxID=3252644 RepID=UPI00366CEC2D
MSKTEHGIFTEPTFAMATHPLYWLPYLRGFLGFGHPFPLLVTVPAGFSRLRASIPLIGYRTGGVFFASGTHPPYWLQYRRVFLGFGHPFPLLVTVPAGFSSLRAFIPLIGYRTDGFFPASGIHSPYWLPYRLISHDYGHPYKAIIYSLFLKAVYK